MKQLHIVVPQFGQTVEANALRTFVGRVRSTTGLPVSVCHQAGAAQPSIDDVRWVPVEVGEEPACGMPRGWVSAAAAVAELEPGCPVLFLAPGNAKLSPRRMAQAVEMMQGDAPEVLVSVVACRDHPCQWEQYFDVVASQAYLPVDSSDRSVADQASALLGAARRPVVSKAFDMPPSGPRLDPACRTPLHEWFPLAGELRPVGGPSKEFSAGPLENRVFLWRERRGRVRQVTCSGEALAALPLLAPVSQAPARIVRGKEGWEVRFVQGLAGPLSVQVYACPGKQTPRGLGGRHCLVRLPEREEGHGETAVVVPPSPGATLVLLNVLSPSSLPSADISLPFVSDGCGWEVDPDTLSRRNASTGLPIAGRQHFPDMYEWEGSILGLSAVALRAPQESLGRAQGVLPIVLDEDEALPVEPWAGSPELCVCGTSGGAGGVPPLAMEDRGKLAEQWRSKLQRVFDGPDGVDALGNRPDSAASLGRALERITAMRQEYRGLTLPVETVGRNVDGLWEPALVPLPLQAHYMFRERGAPDFCGNADDLVFYPLMDRLLEAWTARLGCTPLEACGDMAVHAGRALLGPGWNAGLPLALARRGYLDDARRMLQAEQAIAPWVCDEHVRIAFHCLRREDSLSEYLAWMERDARHGRLSPHWLTHYCEALAGAGKLGRALRLAESDYARRAWQRNCFAAAHLWRYMVRSYAPRRALAGFDHDHREGRLTKDYLITYAYVQAAAGLHTQACATVEEAYAQDKDANGGFALVGWFYHFVRRRDARAALAMLDRDAALGRLDEYSGESIRASCLAYGQDGDAAKAIVDRLYDRHAWARGLYSQIGLAHWLRSKNMDELKAFVRLDHGLERLDACGARVLHAVLCGAGPASDGDAAGALAESLGQMSRPLENCAVWLRKRGLTPAEVKMLLPVSRART